jgi:hypothetical protein
VRTRTLALRWRPRALKSAPYVGFGRRVFLVQPQLSTNLVQSLRIAAIRV